MKWRVAVGIGSARPGSASAADGMAVFFLSMNMGEPPAGRPAQYNVTAATSGGAPSAVAPVADERLLLAPEQHQERGQDRQHQRRRSGQQVREDRVPQPIA